jgi:hypothetical protein
MDEPVRDVHVASMTPKEKKLYLRRRIKEMQANKQQMRVYREICIVPDNLLVKLRDRMADSYRLDMAHRIEELREVRNQGEMVPVPPSFN